MTPETYISEIPAKADYLLGLLDYTPDAPRDKRLDVLTTNLIAAFRNGEALEARSRKQYIPSAPTRLSRLIILFAVGMMFGLQIAQLLHS